MFPTFTGFDRISVDFGGFAAGEQPDPADSGGFRRIPVNSSGFGPDFRRIPDVLSVDFGGFHRNPPDRSSLPAPIRRIPVNPEDFG